MGLSISGVEATLAKLARTGDRTHKRMLRVVRKGADDIAELAKAYAPVDQGNLEDAIEVAESREGFRGRAVIYVGVNPAKLGEGYSRYKHRYDVTMHETSYGLGDASRDKAEASGLIVGPKYLSRALDDKEPEIRNKLEAIARDVEGGA